MREAGAGLSNAKSGRSCGGLLGFEGFVVGTWMREAGAAPSNAKSGRSVGREGVGVAFSKPTPGSVQAPDQVPLGPLWSYEPALRWDSSTPGLTPLVSSVI